MYKEIKAGADNSDLFDKVVELSYENEQLLSKIQVLQDKLQKAYEFMKQFVIIWKEHVGCVPGADWRIEGMGA